jgi:hypothetical protein
MIMKMLRHCPKCDYRGLTSFIVKNVINIFFQLKLRTMQVKTPYIIEDMEGSKWKYEHIERNILKKVV